MTSPDTSAALDPAPPQISLPAGPSAPAAEARTVELRLGTCRVVIDAEGGLPLQFVDDTAPERTYLLDGTTPWHSLEHAWGTGHVVADSFTARWNAPHSSTWTPTASRPRTGSRSRWCWTWNGQAATRSGRRTGSATSRSARCG